MSARGSWGGSRLSGREPGGVVGEGQDAEVGLHPVMAGAAELGAEDGVSSGRGGGEVKMDGLAWDGVLLEAHLGYSEAVDDVLRAEAEVYLAIDGEDQIGGDKVVGAVRVGWVDADRIAFAGGDESRAGTAKSGVGAGVAEVPGELHAGDLDLERGGVGPGVANRGPEELGLDGEGGKENDEEAEREVLDQPAAARLANASAGEQADQQDDVDEGEESGGNPKIEDEMVVERWTMRGGVGRQWPHQQRREWGECHIGRITPGICTLFIPPIV